MTISCWCRRHSTNTALTLVDWRIVDARETACHQPMVVELLELVAVGAKPLASIIVPLVLETHGNAVFTNAPQLLREPVLELRRPLSPEERSNGVAASEKLRAVSPLGVFRTGQRDSLQIAAVPPVLGCLTFEFLQKRSSPQKRRSHLSERTGKRRLVHCALDARAQRRDGPGLIEYA
jgi:hypothetical protein